MGFRVEDVELMVHKFKQSIDLTEELISQNIEVDARIDFITGSVVANFKKKILGNKMDEIKYPINWIEAVKERFLPSLLLKKYPVIYKKHTVMEYYPKLSIPREEATIGFVEGVN